MAESIHFPYVLLLSTKGISAPVLSNTRCDGLLIHAPPHHLEPYRMGFAGLFWNQYLHGTSCRLPCPLSPAVLCLMSEQSRPYAILWGR